MQSQERTKRSRKVGSWLLALMVMMSAWCSLGSTARATDYTWNYLGQNDDWFDARNWTPQGVPGAADTAIIARGNPKPSAPTSVANLVLDADLSGENVTVLNAMTWTDGTLYGSVTIDSAATLSIEGSSTGYVTGTLNNNGTVVKTNTIALFGSGTVNNAGTWRFANSYGILGGRLEFNNSGTIVKDTSALETRLDPEKLNNSGRIVANTGTLTIEDGDNRGVLETAAGANIRVYNFNFANGASIVGAGSVAATGGFNVVGTLNIGAGSTFKLLSGTLNATNAIFAGEGKWEWRGATVKGDLTTNAGLTTIMGGSDTRSLEGTLNLYGNTELYLPAGSWNFGSTSTFNNYGVFTVRDTPADFVNNAVATRQLGTAPAGGLRRLAGPEAVNYGTFNILTDAGTSILYVNRGVFNIGDNFAASGGFSQVAGTTLLNGGNLTGAVSVSGGALIGSGTVNGRLTNGGVVAPGNNAVGQPFGTIRVEGSYEQLASGSLNLDVGGTNAGSNYDVLQVDNTATLSGALRVNTAPGFTPPSGQRFNILSYQSRNNQFSGVNVGAYDVDYGDTVTQLVARAASGGQPSITALSPNSGFTGTTVVITGSNLGNATQVFFGLASATITQRAATQLTVVVPVDALSGRVRVLTPAGSNLSANNFAVLPRIASFTPTQGAPITIITIAGSGFNQVTGVTIGGVRAQFKRDTSTQVRARIPVGARTGKIVVTTLGGTAVSSTDFTVGGGPIITAFSPPSAATGSSIVIVGSNLGEATRVLFGTADATITRREANRLIVTVPVDALSGRVRVLTPAGSNLSANNFAVLPRIASFTPTQGAPITIITIAGSGFNQVIGVTIGGVRAQFKRDTSTQVRARIPVGARTGKIVVTTLGGTAVSSTDFTVPVTSPRALSQAFAPISMATADVATSTLALRFYSNIADIAAADCQVLVNGVAVEVDSVAIKGAVLTIVLPEGSLKAGDSVEVQSAKFGRVRVSNP